MKDFIDCTFQEKLERWEQAKRVLVHLPDHDRTKHWDMGDWGIHTECGTIACAAGHCGMDPWFIERGLELVPAITEACFRRSGNGRFKEAGESVDASFIVQKFFGVRGCSLIFFRSVERSVETVIDEIDKYIEELHIDKGIVA